MTPPAASPSQPALFVSDPKECFKDIRNYLAGRWVGGTRDEAILEEVVKCLYARCFLERQERQKELDGACPEETSVLYQSALAEVKTLLPASFRSDSAQIRLDPEHVVYVDDLLAQIELENGHRDVFADVYEAFSGAVKRGAEGQFFTPQNAVDLLVSIVDPQPGEAIVDPACGAGTFLSTAAQALIDRGVDEQEACEHLYGIEKDEYLADLAAARLALMTFGEPNIHWADSLAWAPADGNDFPIQDRLGTFDVVLTNPPFGSRIVAASEAVQREFDLGYKWELSENGEQYVKSSELTQRVPPQVLFVERCLDLIAPGGRVGMVVPESLVSGKKYRHVVQYIRERANLHAVVGMPEPLFKTSGKGGTHTKTCLIVFEKPDGQQPSSDHEVFMAEARWCGHDSRGRPIKYDDLPRIRENYVQFQQEGFERFDTLGFSVESNRIKENILAPRYYNEAVDGDLEDLEATHELITLGELFEEGLVQKSTGDEVGKLAYGTGPIPFVRTSDISNWEIKVDPKHCVSEEIYEDLAEKQDVQAGDILLVKDGTYLIGTCAFVSEFDERIVYQSHLYKLRCTDHKRLSPYLLLATLSSSIVQRQIKTKRFTHDIIDSLGGRINELVLPIPKENERRYEIESTVKEALEERASYRESLRAACDAVTEQQPG